MLRLSENVRFWLEVGTLSAAALGVGTRLVMMHLNLTDVEIKQPNYVFTRELKGLRGAIFAAGQGAHPFARSVKVWEYHADPKAVNLKRHSREFVVSNVAEALNLPPEQVRKAYWRTDSRYVYLGKSYDDAAYKVLKNPALASGLQIEERHLRLYPQGRRLAHVLGFVNLADGVGSGGLEQRFNRDLKGAAGLVEGERDALGNELYNRRRISTPATDGESIRLTIDQNIQWEVERALADGRATCRAERAWAIVLSVKTGAILAMACLPDFEPEKYNRYPDPVRLNRAIGENYEPGSVMKTITACAALDCGLVGPDTMINTSQFEDGYFRLPGDHGHHWEPLMSVREALVHSSNIVYGKLGVRLGPRRLRGYMASFGLGAKTGVELPGEEGGILPSLQEWERDRIKWSRAPIGQGVAVTALQLAAAYAAIGNDGELLRPYLVESRTDAAGRETYRHRREVVGHPIRPETARKVREMMLGVAKKGGTARRAAVQGYTVAGKTGTAQMKEGRGYSERDYHASFIGIVPATRPEIVILVTFQKPFFCRSYNLSQSTGIPLYNHQGGVCAAPVFSRIASIVLRYLEVEPDMPNEIPEDQSAK